MSETVLLAGGLGFIGHNLALKLKKEGMQPVILDNYGQNIKNQWHRKIVDDRIEMIRKAEIPIFSGDTRNPDNVTNIVMETQPSRIIHLAAIPSVVLSNLDPGTSFDHNLLSTKIILETIRNKKIPLKQLVYFSSSTVYGDFKTPSVNEDSPTKPKGIYEAAKLSSEIVINAYKNLIGVPFTIIRPSALYGERCINNRVSQIFVENAMKGLPIKVEGDGSEKLDFTYIDDLVQGVYLSLTTEKAINQTFNITAGNAERVNTLVDILKEYFPKLQVENVIRDKMKPMRGTLEIDRAKNLLGYEPQYTLAKGYRKYVEWYLSSDFKDFH